MEEGLSRLAGGRGAEACQGLQPRAGCAGGRVVILILVWCGGMTAGGYKS